MKQNKPRKIDPWTAVRITRSIAAELHKFVSPTGQTKTFVVTAALTAYMERNKSK